MIETEFHEAAQQWAGAKDSAIAALSKVDNWSGAQVSCYEFSDLEAWHAARWKIFKAAAGHSVGINRYDEPDGRKAVIVVVPNVEAQSKIAQAIGTPKFSKPLYPPAPPGVV